jgi:hypothetical protein
VTPDQIDAVTDAAIRLQELGDLYGPGLILASGLVVAWRASRWICRRALQACDWARQRRELRRTPAAFDNQPPQDDDALDACLRIAGLHPTDPDNSRNDWRNATRYLREKGDETP